MTNIMNYLYSLQQKIVENNCKIFRSYGTVYMFHQINNDMNVWDTPNCSITYNSFNRFIKILNDNKVTWSSIPCILNSKSSSNRFITFDDVYEDVYSKAAPLLLDYGIPFTIFITLNFLNKDRYLTIDMLKELSNESLCTIGVHSLSHPNLRKINLDDSWYEITESGKRLSDMLNRHIDIFAFPYGSIYACSIENIKQAELAGYSMAFSTINSCLTKDLIKNRWFLPRRNVNEINFMKYL